MSKYEPLRHHLEGRLGDEITMTFADVERILGFPLPPSARAHQAWWSNNVGTHVGVRAWRDAGFKTARLDLGGERVTLIREQTPEPAPGLGESKSPAFDGDAILLQRSRLSSAAQRLVDDYAEAAGSDPAAAITAMLDAFAIQRRRELLESFARRGNAGAGDSVGLIREDRDGR